MFFNNNNRISMKKASYETNIIYVMKFITKKGIDLYEFLSSNLYISENRSYLIESIYGKLHGYDIVYNMCNKTINGETYYEVQCIKKENGHKMDLDKVNVVWDNNILIISDSEVSYKYEVNERGIISVNGECLPFQVECLTNAEIEKDKVKSL